MRILVLVFLLCLNTGCVSSRSVIGYSGGTVRIRCDYPSDKTSNAKYFCAGPEGSVGCEELIRSEMGNVWVDKGRFSLVDYAGSKYTIVTFRNLTREDEGTYWCGVDIPGSPDHYSKVELSVQKGQRSVQQTGHLGGHASITCFYPAELSDITKFFFREESINSYRRLISLRTDQVSETSGRFSVSDNRNSTFTFTISDLTEEDSGTYWCGVYRGGYYESLITQLLLTVQVPATTSSSVSFMSSSSSPPSSSSHVPATTSSSVSFMSSSSSPPSSSSHGTPVIIGVCVSLALVLSVFLVLLYRRMSSKNQEPVPPATRSPRLNQHTGNTGEGSQDYENDPVANAVMFNSMNDAVYQNLHPQTTNQDPLYQNLHPQTTNQDPLYQSLNPQTTDQNALYQSLHPQTTNQEA